MSEIEENKTVQPEDLGGKEKSVVDKAEDLIEGSVEKIKSSETFGKIASFFDKVEDFIEKKVDDVKESGIADKIEEFADKAEDKAEAAFKKAKEAGSVITTKFKEAVDEIKGEKAETPEQPVAQAEQPVQTPPETTAPAQEAATNV